MPEVSQATKSPVKDDKRVKFWRFVAMQQKSR